MPHVHRSIGVLLRLAHQHFSTAVDSALSEAGFGDIRPHHANVFTLVPAEGIKVSELTLRAGMRKQSMTQAVEELETLGYVERRPHTTDRRARLVFLTQRGHAVRPLAMAAGEGVEETWAKRLGDSELEALRLSLQNLLLEIGSDKA